MQMGSNILSLPAVALMCLAVSCGILSAFFLWQQIGEINRKLPDDEQISYWGMHPIKMARIKREYVRLYPSGKIDLMRRIFQYAAFALMALSLIPLGFFK
jgi:hypothetical protein